MRYAQRNVWESLQSFEPYTPSEDDDSQKPAGPDRPLTLKVCVYVG